MSAAETQSGRQERPQEEAQDASLFEQSGEREALQLQLGAYDGPLDLLLDLASSKKIDLTELSMLALAEQYLEFLHEVRRARLDIAAEYLVMAAKLIYMKSRLLLPKPPEDDEPSGEEMAAYLAFQLERLAGLRRAAEDLLDRPRLGEAFFPRGEPERRIVTTSVEWVATQHELLMAYARQRTKSNFKPLHLERRSVVAIDQALLRLRRALEGTPGWAELVKFLPDEWRDDGHLRSAVASTFAAALELAKHGQVTLKQDAPFAPIYIQPEARQPSGGREALANAVEEMVRRRRAAEAAGPQRETAGRSERPDRDERPRKGDAA